MTHEDQIADLEGRLESARRAAVLMVTGMADAVVKTPQGYEDLARGFDEAAKASDGEMQLIADMVAEALRARTDG
ncbi:hypothetical protein [Roseovarius confluentis]|uniref:hypothetical protein n=1 Tax=Roseovarius confluentis TaxID=1852027 RepID=UPI003BACAAE3